MTHIILEILKWTGSQVVGAGGLGLGIYNYRRGKNEHQHALDAPKREAQRTYRAQLRTLLLPVKSQCEDALRTLKLGEELSEDTPIIFKDVQSRVDEIAVVIKQPGSLDMMKAHSFISDVGYSWSSQKWARRSDRPGEPPSDQQKRRYDAARQDLRERLEKLIDHIDKCIKTTVEEDDK